MKKTLVLVRHGQTLFNLKDKVQGWCDSRLTNLGKLQAEAAKKVLQEKGFEFDHVYCSDLNRTEETLQILSDLPYERKAGLKERSYGILEGDSNLIGLAGHRDPEYYVQFDGESTPELVARVKETIQEIMSREDHQTVLAVSHGDAMISTAETLVPEDDEKLKRFSNCMIHIYLWEDGKLTLEESITDHVSGLSSDKIL